MMVGADAHGKTIAIYGLGQIGAAVAKRVMNAVERVAAANLVAPPPANSHETRSRILHTAFQLFHEQGFNATGIDLEDCALAMSTTAIAGSVEIAGGVVDQACVGVRRIGSAVEGIQYVVALGVG